VVSQCLSLKQAAVARPHPGSGLRLRDSQARRTQSHIKSYSGYRLLKSLGLPWPCSRRSQQRRLRATPWRLPPATTRPCARHVTISEPMGTIARQAACTSRWHRQLMPPVAIVQAAVSRQLATPTVKPPPHNGTATSTGHRVSTRSDASLALIPTRSKTALWGNVCIDYEATGLSEGESTMPGR
jgi:hypothetical protein